MSHMPSAGCRLLVRTITTSGRARRREVAMPSFASFDGTEIFYETTGAGRPVLLIHGFSSDGDRGWVSRGIAAKLVDAGRQAVVIDLRGHGRSAKPHEAPAYAGDTLVRDCQRLLDHLGFQVVDVVGYSLGSRTAARLAILDVRVRSLILGGCGDADAGGPAAAWLAGILEADDPSSLDPASQAIRADIMSRGGDLAALAAFCRAHIGGEDRIEVVGIDVPTLFVTGVDDHVPGEVAPLLERLPGSRWVQVPGDHLAAPDDPTFLQTVLDFLAELQPVPTF